MIRTYVFIFIVNNENEENCPNILIDKIDQASS